MTHRTGRPRGVIPDGAKIRRLRIDLGLSTAQLAERIDRHPQHVRHSERSLPVSEVTASRLARALGVKMSDIIAGDGSRSRSGAEAKAPAA